MNYRKIEGEYNGKQYHVEVAVEEAFAMTGLFQCGWTPMLVVIDGKNVDPLKDKFDAEELFDFITYNIGNE